MDNELQRKSALSPTASKSPSSQGKVLFPSLWWETCLFHSSQLFLLLVLPMSIKAFVEKADAFVQVVQVINEHPVSYHSLLSNTTLQFIPLPASKEGSPWSRGPWSVLWGAFQSFPGSRCCHIPRTSPSSRSNDQPLWGAEGWPLRETIWEHPERNSCRPAAPGPVSPCLPPKRGSLRLLSSLPCNTAGALEGELAVAFPEIAEPSPLGSHGF